MLGAGIAIIGLVAGASYYEGLKPDRAIEHPAPALLPVRSCDWVREMDLQQRAARWWAAVEGQPAQRATHRYADDDERQRRRGIRPGGVSLGQQVFVRGRRGASLMCSCP